MRKNKVLKYVIQVIGWGIVFGFPLFFTWKEVEPISWLRYLGYVFVPVAFMIVFYCNYFFLIDRLLFRRGLVQFLLVNLVLFVVLSLLLDWWHGYYIVNIQGNKFHIGGPPKIVFILRDCMTMALTAALSVAIRMTENWYVLEDEKKELEKARAEAELQNLKNQLNPHFLFNTLECIRSLAHTRNERCIENLALYMAHNFCYALYAPPVVSLSQEIAHVKNYLNIMNIRFNGKYKFKNQITCERCLTWQVPSMFLQPIVENSVKHAFTHSHKAECVISLQARIEAESRLILHIADNGSGFSEEQQQKLETKVFFYSKNGCSKGEGEDGIGLSNVIWRMKLVYGSAFHFRILSKAEHYTVFDLVIPTLSKNPDFSEIQASGR